MGGVFLVEALKLFPSIKTSESFCQHIWFPVLLAIFQKPKYSSHCKETPGLPRTTNKQTDLHGVSTAGSFLYLLEDLIVLWNTNYS